MKKYILKRILFSLFSLIIVIGVVIILIYNLINRYGILLNDPNYTKVQYNEKKVFECQRFQEYGYIDYENMGSNAEYINLDSESKKVITNLMKKETTTLADLVQASPFVSSYVTKMESNGYAVEYLPRKLQKTARVTKELSAPFLICTRERGVFARLGDLFSNMFCFETIWDVQDENLTDRGIKLTWDMRSNMPAIIGSGTTHKYLLYFDNQFPFVHQNFFHLRLGKSFVLQKGTDVVDYMQLRTGDRLNDYQIAPKDIDNEETYTKYATFDFIDTNAASETQTDTETPEVLEAINVNEAAPITRSVDLGEWANGNNVTILKAFDRLDAEIGEYIVSSSVSFPAETAKVQLFLMPEGSTSVDEETAIRKTDLITVIEGNLQFISNDRRIKTGYDFHTVTYSNSEPSANYYSPDDHYANAGSAKDGLTRIGLSFVIGIIAVFISYLIGIPVGIWMAQRKDKLVDKLGNFYIIFIMAVPSLAYIFMLASFGIAYLGLPKNFALAQVRILAFIMPIISLSMRSIGGLMKWMRRYMIDQQNSDYVKFARSQGLSEGEIFSKHISRNALIYLVHGIPGEILACLIGAIITERVYGVPGVGNMLTDAIAKYDNSAIVGVTIFYTTLTIVSLILGDVLLSKYDPRISLSSERN